MWALLKALVTKVALFKALLKAIGGLAWLIPVAFILKAIGLPALILLAVLAAPIIIVLVIIGLPLLAVFAVGGVLLTVLMFIVSIGITALKIVIPVVLIVWLVNWFLHRNKGSDGATEPPAPATGTVEGP